MIYGESTPMMPIVMLVGPEDLNTAANPSAWVSMADCDYGLIIIAIGDVAGGAAAVTLDQASDSSGTGSKTLSFTKYYTTGQRLAIDGVSGTFSEGETITGGTSANTARVIKVRNDELVIGFLTGSTTWTDNETITGGTSGATASVNGTGSDEDILVERTAASDTFSTVAATFKLYVIPVDAAMLDVDNEFDHFQLDIAQAATSETQGCAIFVPLSMSVMKYPQRSLIGAQKIV